MTIIPRNKRPGFIPDLLFITCLLAGLFPVLRYAHFTTLDGAAHCYNAAIMQSLLCDGSSVYKGWFTFNAFPVPNYSGHVLLALLHTLFSWNASEKIIAMLFLVLVPVLFRKIVLLGNPGNRWWPLVIFPFTHYVLLYYGFYNFSLGVIFLLAGIYLRLRPTASPARPLLQVFLFSALLYFSHLFTFLIYLFFIAACELSTAICTKEVKPFLTRSLKLLLITAPFVALAFAYFYMNPSQEDEFWSAGKTFSFWLEAGYLKVYALDESYFCNVLAGSMLLVGFFITAFYAWRRFSEKPVSAQPLFLLMFALMVLLAFTMPDFSGNAGYIVYRFVYLGMLFLLLWAGSVNTGKYIPAAIAVLAIVCHAGIQVKNARGQGLINDEYEAYSKAAGHIGDKAVVAPVFISGLGFAEHFSNYLCGDKQLVILENYEAYTNYFPVKWDKASLPRAYFPDSLAWLDDGRYVKGKGAAMLVPDYILLQGSPLPVLDTILKEIGRSFSLIYSNNTVSLYQKKRR